MKLIDGLYDRLFPRFPKYAYTTLGDLMPQRALHSAQSDRLNYQQKQKCAEGLNLKFLLCLAVAFLLGLVLLLFREQGTEALLHVFLLLGIMWFSSSILSAHYAQVIKAHDRYISSMKT